MARKTVDYSRRSSESKRNTNGSVTRLGRTTHTHPSVGELRHRDLDDMARRNQSRD